LLNTAERKESAVLRVTTNIESGTTRFVVEGKLKGACVGELERCWQAIASREAAESILVDLSSVSFVDAAGKQLLTRMHEQGVRFTAAGLLGKSLIEEIGRCAM
jgi:anti-anti-sigma regulatory factor